MMLTLKIENYQSLEGGGPVEITSTGQTVRVGRNAGMDWVLPDPARFISSHHFDVELRGNDWWLIDRSTNGTYLVGQPWRLDGPHRLTSGERFQVGHYFIVVLMAEDARRQPPSRAYPSFAPAPPPTPGGFGDEDPWAVGGAVDPVDPMPRAAPGQYADFSDEFISTSFQPEPPPAAPPPSVMPVPGAGLPPAGGGAGALASPFDDAADPAFPSIPQPPASMFDPAPGPGGRMPASVPPPPMPAPSVPRSGGGLQLPPGAPAPSPAPPAAAEPSGAAGTQFLRAFFEGAGLPQDYAEGAEPEDLARDLGRTMRALAEELRAMLQDRANAKRFTRAGERTMMGASNNNPLKFMPDADQALAAMFGPPRSGFMQGGAAVTAALHDLRLHQMAVFAAIQPALSNLLADLDPADIEAAAGASRLGGGKRKAWDMFVERWDAKAGRTENGMLDVFLAGFAEAYAGAVANARRNDQG